ncbi:MAG: hypothetical protein HWD61_01705 [Parachlamydiaceae bacterium]|nr:MAG: hypothetical protein HWD61_01705 [Parachlamydiaceae bacterium]
MEQTFDNEEIKNILRSILRSVLKLGVSIQEIKLENERGEQNLQLYRMGFRINPNTMVNIHDGKAYTLDTLKQCFEVDNEYYNKLYQGFLSMVASDELITFISSEFVDDNVSKETEKVKSIESQSGEYKIQTHVEIDKDELSCRSQIAGEDQKEILFDCQFNILKESDGLIIQMSHIDLRKNLKMQS